MRKGQFGAHRCEVDEICGRKGDLKPSLARKNRRIGWQIKHHAIHQSAMRIALYQPDIPHNTGAILRMAACLGIRVDVIGPAGFDLSERALRRAGLDYLQYAEITQHVSFASFLADRGKTPRGRLVLLTTKGDTAYTGFAFAKEDVLLLGRESAGVPDDVHGAADARLIIPMQQGRRSLNIAIAAAMVTGEALRQCDGFEEAVC